MDPLVAFFFFFAVLLFVYSLSHVQLFVTPWTAAYQAPRSSTVSQSLLRFMFIELVMLPNHFTLGCPFSFCLQSFPALRSFLMSWLFTSGGQKYWGFSLSIRPSSGYSGLISFRIDGFDLFAVHGTLKSLLQVALVKNTTLSFWLRNLPLTAAR